jgi:ankyrin repeat protein
MNRKKFINQSMAGIIPLFAMPSFVPTQNEPPRLKMKLVKEFVVAGHGNLDKVKQMLADHPNLIYSRYDWGNGDFEEAIEGAGHLGNKEIAKYLIDQGVRVNLFVLTMLGKTDLVKPVLETYPKLVFAKGAHGFTLLHHAKAGGSDAEALYAYLQEKGLKEMQTKIK